MRRRGAQEPLVSLGVTIDPTSLPFIFEVRDRGSVAHQNAPKRSMFAASRHLTISRSRRRNAISGYGISRTCWRNDVVRSSFVVRLSSRPRHRRIKPRQKRRQLLRVRATSSGSRVSTSSTVVPFRRASTSGMPRCYRGTRARSFTNWTASGRTPGASSPSASSMTACGPKSNQTE